MLCAILCPHPHPPCRGQHGVTWFGQLVALVDTASSSASRVTANQWAFVRWLTNAPESGASKLLQMTRLRWCSHSRRPPGGGPRQLMPYYDLVPLADIIDPVCLVPDETGAGSEGHFFYNHFVR